MATTPTRKQREIAQREQLIIDVAHKLLLTEGATSITMERIANETEYAKGTIYNHFLCREDILAAVCCKARQELLRQLHIAAQFDGNHRERFLAIAAIYQIYARDNPAIFDLVLDSSEDDFKSRMHESRKTQLDSLEQHCHQVMFELVEAALGQGELTLPENLPVKEFCFGVWSLAYGIFSLWQCPNTKTQFGVSSLRHSLQTQVNHFLDGYGWQPTSNNWDYPQSLEKIKAYLIEKA